MAQFRISLIGRKRAWVSTGQYNFGRLVGADVSPLYRIKKRKRRQTHLPPSSPHRETSNPLYDSRDTTGKRCGAKSARRRRKFSGVSFQTSLSLVPPLLFAFPRFLPPLRTPSLLLRVALWSVCSELFFRHGAPSRSFWISLSFRITCRALSSVSLWIFSSKTDLIRPFSASRRYLALVEKSSRRRERANYEICVYCSYRVNVNFENLETHLVISILDWFSDIFRMA